MTVANWAWWGLGWLFMPRMIIGIMIGTLTNHATLGLTLAITGGIIDITNN